ncbi:MAG: response regulator [Parachlamydiaceae bacterium]|nr:response regulator [Parachlamydiaceae bacterium]
MTQVLIVEDNEMNRDMLGRRLIRKGYEIIYALNGEEAIEKAKSKPDIILMDLSLPIMTGWDAIKLLRTMESTSNIPIIAITAHALSGEMETAFEAGCNDYLTKPIEFDLLLEKMEALLKK